jgi:hypothetical protein
MQAEPTVPQDAAAASRPDDTEPATKSARVASQSLDYAMEEAAAAQARSGKGASGAKRKQPEAEQELVRAVTSWVHSRV